MPRTPPPALSYIKGKGIVDDRENVYYISKAEVEEVASCEKVMDGRAIIRDLLQLQAGPRIKVKISWSMYQEILHSFGIYKELNGSNLKILCRYCNELMNGSSVATEIQYGECEACAIKKLHI